VRRREFLKKVPLFGAGAALGLNALSEAGEVPKARKLSGADVGPLVFSCNSGACNSGSLSTACYSGDTSTVPPTCTYGGPTIVCNTGTCNVGA
jgi:hypothetical protein